MGTYIPNTGNEQREMLEEAGFQSFDDLYTEIPECVRLNRKLDLPEGSPELSVRRQVEALAGRNRIFNYIFRGAGAYNHYIPAVVEEVASKERFVTAYTPYQAEISQGILQSIFEYQTMICELTGMEASNASVYDGASAAAEAAAMCTDRKRKTVLASAAINPGVYQVLKTYCFGSGNRLVPVPEKNGVTDLKKLREMLSAECACFYVEQPNYFGQVEDVETMADIVHEAGAKLVAGGNPIAMALLRTPGECGADVAVGEGQPLGIPLSFGGPYLGFMAATKEMFRRLPGRMVGETSDAGGNRGYVLTLQAREQHIRREKAGSNICSNEALCAVRAAAYMAVMGEEGLRETARQCYSKAHYFQKKLKTAGLSRVYPGDFFHEFVTRSDIPSRMILKKLEDHGILGGLPLDETRILWCVTELNTKEEMDEAVRIVEEVAGS
ncbi:aminomethyl-transferring glycine dehydrogenase subunit GcvPA [Lacrimispora sp. NSJ-141]|uniref:Probable glycine dehydrogenase (decarboxylating) subunit 1 n=1 Tax=Lientehia hominis TaxID=2897778 RepID=A0AAP2W9I8_9FIRM|nr:aminomethyl-transferring glycine dehydrogenase subunit GcvPA [Lientehia hominis]MCD2493420.1 aminomethyl-transferring glycine dehydrogenase subunit GcvPA [Lientehia hominis]